MANFLLIGTLKDGKEDNYELKWTRCKHSWIWHLKEWC